MLLFLKLIDIIVILFNAFDVFGHCRMKREFVVLMVWAGALIRLILAVFIFAASRNRAFHMLYDSMQKCNDCVYAAVDMPTSVVKWRSWFLGFSRISNSLGFIVCSRVLSDMMLDFIALCLYRAGRRHHSSRVSYIYFINFRCFDMSPSTSSRR